MCCKEIPGTTEVEDIFQILNNYLVKWDLSWKSCIGICTNGAPSMVGCLKEFTTLLKESQNPNIITTHCFLHREALIAKTLRDELKKVLNQVIEMVNFIKSRPLKCRLFEQICIGMDSQHKRLLLHSVFWISIREEYPSTAKKALSILIQFSTSYLRELGFLSLTNIKCKKRQNIQCVEEELRVCLLHIYPNIKEIAKGYQEDQLHVSHTQNV